MAKLAIAPAALADLRSIRNYSKAAFGPNVALAYLNGIREQFAAALLRPRAGKIESDLGEEMRSIAFRSHRIYYRIEDDGILIVRILHQAQDLARAFGSRT